MTLRFSNGRYEADFYIKGRGTRLRRRFDPDLSEEEARAYYQELIIQYKGQPTEPTHLGLTISQLTQKYLEWYDLFRQKTTVKDARGVFEGPSIESSAPSSLKISFPVTSWSISANAVTTRSQTGQSTKSSIIFPAASDGHHRRKTDTSRRGNGK